MCRKANAEFGWDTAELEADEIKGLSDWAMLVARRHDELRAWVDGLPEFWALLAPFDTVSEPTREFVEAMVTWARRDPAEFTENAIGACDDPQSRDPPQDEAGSPRPSVSARELEPGAVR